MQRSSVSQLPAEIREELESRLIGSGFGGYTSLSEWLAGQGYEISRSAVHRHGQRLERQISKVKAATEMAVALVKDTPDDQGATSEAALRIVQQKMFELLLETEDGDIKSMGAAATALGRAARANLAVRTERRKAMTEAADKVRSEQAALGLSDEVLERIDAILMPVG